MYGSIRKLYNPVQPAVALSSYSPVSYIEIIPDKRLQDFIFCYWQLKSVGRIHGGYAYRVVADGCIDIFFEMQNPVKNYIMGFCKQYSEFQLDHRFNYTGVRFLPSAFPLLFGIDASELRNRFENLDAVAPDISEFIAAHFDHGFSADRIKGLFDNFFLKQIAAKEPVYDNRFRNALHLILEHNGVLNIERDLETGISPRHLRRMFHYYIGDTAKSFSRVVRFQNILTSKPSVQSLNGNKLFFDSGFYDQAHFIKEFKSFSGLTPGRAFGR